MNSDKAEDIFAWKSDKNTDEREKREIKIGAMRYNKKFGRWGQKKK